MKILALITARGDSKRLPGKNILPLGGKPMIVWSIDVVRDIPEICDILVSTDSSDIASICKKNNAYVPWLRPKKLATDTSNSVDVAIHALDWYEKEKGLIDGVLLLQPTSPFRTKHSIQKGIELYIKNNYKSVTGVSPTHSHPMWTFKMEGDCLIPFIQNHGFKTRSQDLLPAFILNGSFYLISPTKLRACHSFVEEKSIPLIIDSPAESLDIDSAWDFKIAEFIVESMYEN